MVARLVVATVLVVGLSSPAPAKGPLCPSGSFKLDMQRWGRAVETDLVLELGDGTVAIPGRCPAAPPRRSVYWWDAERKWFIGPSVLWTDCDGGWPRVKMRGRFDIDCASLRGVIQTRGGGRRKFRAHRVPVCGDGVLQAPEGCDDGGDHGCCGSDCRALDPGCTGACQSDADCADAALCEWGGPCGVLSGTCRRRGHSEECRGEAVPGQAVCGCDDQSYPSACAAWAAGLPVGHLGACGTLCAADGRWSCARGMFCELGGWTCEQKTGAAIGRCVVVPDAATCPRRVR